MSELVFKNIKMPHAKMNGESSLPPLSELVKNTSVSATNLDEDDELCVSYGQVRSPFPYRMQDLYSRELFDTDFPVAILENEYLRATFAPTVGGKLWSLYDKKAQKDLLFDNPVMRPCNLAIRNAWTSGGVEWNLGFVGHHPNTCSEMFTAKTSLEDGTPVLRMYSYERVRGMVYQMDFFLPDSSKMLYARMRVVNPNALVTPVYWWSNIAVPELSDGRVIVDADNCFTFVDGAVSKVGVPNFGGRDISYPVNSPHSIDFFFNVPHEKRKYIAQLNRSGYGFVQTSTSRLIGRKLFVWGQGPGGDRWQQYLTADNSNGRYAEIQAGLAHSQYESLPMPPKTAWEWLEAYGSLSCNGDAVHGEWKTARNETEQKLNEIITEDYLEKLLRDTKKMALAPAGQLLFRGEGWCALENYRRKSCGIKQIEPHLDFGEIGKGQKQWQHLLDSEIWDNHSPLDVPTSWMLQPEWMALICRSAEVSDELNWYSHLQYGMTLLASGEIDNAKTHLERSLALSENPWAIYGLAQIARLNGEYERHAMLILRAAKMLPNDISFAKETCRVLNVCGKYALNAEFIENLSEEIRAVPRIGLYLAAAYTKLGRIEDAEKIMYNGGGLVVADIREGEISITDLWFELEELKCKRDGIVFNRTSAKPPIIFDFRMNAEK